MALIVNVIVVQLEGHSFECTGNRQHSNHMWVEQAVDPQKPSLSSVSYRAKFMSYIIHWQTGRQTETVL